MATEITSLAVKFTADMAGFQRGMAQVQRGVAQAEGSFAGLHQNFRRVTAAVGGLAAGFAGLKIVGLAKDAALASARFETLGIVMERVGRNAGYNAAQMHEFDRGLRKTGISILESRSALASLVGAQVDLAQSTKLARVAQDAAVIGGINSSEAFGRMVTGIANANTVTLRTIGLNVNFEKSYQALARALDKNVDQLTEQERTQARVNAVLEAGAGIAGTYEAAMGTAGKQLGSLSRLLSDLSTTSGKVFNEALRRSVFGASDAIGNLNKALANLGDDRIQSWGKTLADVLTVAKNATVALAAVFAGRMVVSLGAATATAVKKAQATLAATRAQHAANVAARDGALAELQMARAMGTSTAARMAQRQAAIGLATASRAVAASTAQVTVAARAATLATRGLSAAFGLLGGWPGVIAIGLGVIAYKLMDIKSKAREAAEGIKDAIADATAGFAELDKVGTLSRLGTARKELHALGQAVTDLEAKAKAEAASLGPTGFVRGVASPETLAALESARRAFEVTRGEVAALEKQYVSLAKLDPPAPPLDNARRAIEQTTENFARLAEQAADAQEQIAALKLESALVPVGEELDRVNKKLAETEARFAAIQSEMAKFRALSLPDAPAPGVQRTDSGLQRVGIVSAGRRVQAVGPTAVGAAEAALQKWLDNPAITAAALKSGEFADQLDATKRVLDEEAKRRKEINKLLGLEVGSRKIGAGDVGATLSGVGGMVGGRAGGAMSGVGSAITAAVSATNPLTMAVGVFGGAMGALTSLFSGGASKVERMREAFDRLMSFMQRKFDLLDTSTAEQFEQTRAEMLKRMGAGELKSMLAGSNLGNIQDFINEVVGRIDAAKNAATWLERNIAQTKLSAAFGGLSEEQILDFLGGLKRLTDATNDAVSAMLNVPQGFKVALARFNASEGRVATPPNAPPADVSKPYAPPGSGITFGDVHIYAPEGASPREIWEGVKEEARREAQRGGVGGRLVFAA